MKYRNIFYLIFCIRQSVVLVQHPITHNSLRKYLSIKLILKKHQAVALVHDIDHCRMDIKNKRDLKLLSQYKRIITTGYLEQFFVKNAKANMQRLKVWDYQLESDSTIHADAKAGFSLLYAGKMYPKHIKDLMQSTQKPVALFGTNFTEPEQKGNYAYFGAFDGDRPDFSNVVNPWGIVFTTAHPTYFKYNCPHKLSLYLACGIPVIVFAETYAAHFVENNGCGIVINNIDEVDTALAKKDHEQYLKLQAKAIAIGQKMQTGYFLREALEELFR